MSELPATPDELVSADIADGRVELVVDGSMYPRDAIYAAAFTFIDRAYVFLSRGDGEEVRVALSLKTLPAQAGDLRDLVGAFANELLTAAWRLELTREHKATLEAVTTRAFAGAMGPPSLEDLDDFDFGGDELEDPLGIAKSWEETHGKKAPGKDGSR